MRRLLSGILFAVLLIQIFPSLAEKDEILFRGLPWGCHPDAFEENLGIELQEPYVSNISFWASMNDVYFGATDISNNEIGYWDFKKEGVVAHEQINDYLL